MQTMRREIHSFVSRKSFKYNDVIDSKIVNLDIWCHFLFLKELSWKLKSDINSRSISDWVRMLKSSIWVESEDWYRVLKLSQKIDIETQLNNQFNATSSWWLQIMMSLCLLLRRCQIIDSLIIFSLMMKISLQLSLQNLMNMSEWFWIASCMNWSNDIKSKCCVIRFFCKVQQIIFNSADLAQKSH